MSGPAAEPRQRTPAASQIPGPVIAETPESSGAVDQTGAHDSASDQPLFSFVSIPDFFNNDIDISTTVPGGSPPEMVEVVDFVMDAIEQEDPAFVLVAGDLLNSRWHLDKPGDAYFGPVTTREQKRAAIETAGALYYPGWRSLFTSRNLAVYPAIGDHELGDNDWPPGEDKSFLVPHYRSVFANELLDHALDERFRAQPLFDGQGVSRPVGTQWEETAYAFVHQNSLIVSLDVFRQDDPVTELDSRTGSVLATVSGGQLTWLRTLFEVARRSGVIEHIIVQGHTPILTPVRVRNSSELYLRDDDGAMGSATDVWQLFAEYDVAMYLSGEVHDISMSHAESVHQLVNGAVVGLNPRINYLVVDVFVDRLEFIAKEIRVVRLPDSVLWSTSGELRWVVRLRNSAREGGFLPVGSLTLRRVDDGYRSDEAEGTLECYGTCLEESP